MEYRGTLTMLVTAVVAAFALAANPQESTTQPATKPAATTQPSARTPSTDKTSGITFIEVKPGAFTMGEGKDTRRVTIDKGYALASTVVTQKQWKAVMGTEPWKGKISTQEGDAYPATWVNFDDVQAFCKKLSAASGQTIRLPTEAEWEYACRAGTKTKYYFGDSPAKLGDHAWFLDNAYARKEGYPHEVAKKKPNPWGFFDMHGNTWEWTSDPWSSDQKGSEKAIRGGAFFGNAGSCAVTYRSFSAPGSTSYHLTFRPVREIEATK